ncbi:MAG TPA: Holliday junction branch migration protein RuvA [Candidatus Paceibacterota bacterium]
MIAHLAGKVLAVRPGHLVLDVGGVGYKVAASPATLALAKVGGTLSLSIHTAVRDDAIDLYGFPNDGELSLFEMLLTVSGVGPKTAIGVVGGATAETIREGIASGDPAYLSKMTGVGKKLAEKIVVELKDKMGDLGTVGTGATGGAATAVEALAALGYAESDARNAVSKLDRSLSTEEIVRQALKALGQGR